MNGSYGARINCNVWWSDWRLPEKVHLGLGLYLMSNDRFTVDYYHHIIQCWDYLLCLLIWLWITRKGSPRAWIISHVWWSRYCRLLSLHHTVLPLYIYFTADYYLRIIQVLGLSVLLSDLTVDYQEWITPILDFISNMRITLLQIIITAFYSSTIISNVE